MSDCTHALRRITKGKECKAGTEPDITVLVGWWLHTYTHSFYNLLVNSFLQYDGDCSVFHNEPFLMKSS